MLVIHISFHLTGFTKEQTNVITISDWPSMDHIQEHCRQITGERWTPRVWINGKVLANFWTGFQWLQFVVVVVESRCIYLHILFALEHTWSAVQSYTSPQLSNFHCSSNHDHYYIVYFYMILQQLLLLGDGRAQRN